MKNLCFILIALLMSFVSSAIEPITGPSSVCTGRSIYLNDSTPGGTWSSSDVTIAATSGTTSSWVNGVAPGTATITYTVGSLFVTTVITVNPTPSSITGDINVCVGSSSTLACAEPGGTWSSSNPAIATAGGGGVTTGISYGATFISYTLPGGCSSSTVFYVSVLPTGITGASTVCAGGTATVTASTGYGVWSSSVPGVATVAGSIAATVTGISTGVTTLSYTNVCGYVTRDITVVIGPTAITGVATICVGRTSTLSNSISGGTWSSSAPAVASVSPTTGVVTGNTAGTATITYSLGTGCFVTRPVTVITAPGPIYGSTTLCNGTTTYLSNSSPGGTWTSSILTVAAVGSSSGMVTGLSAGVTTISYILGAGCAVSAVVNVVSAPTAITGTPSSCVGGTTTLADATAGGTWSSSDLAVAVVTGSPSGIVTGIAPGTSVISYTTACGIVTTVFTVYARPTVTATSATTCGRLITLTAAGASTYSWSPTTGLSCPTCSTTDANISYTTNYVVTGTGTAGCINTTTVTVEGNRILGKVSFSTTPPDTLDMKVWLIQFNPADSSITALDSTITCLSGGVPYYEFDGRAAGRYMVKGRMLHGSIPGSSGYIPTYSAASPFWYAAASVSHFLSTTDSMNINMQYGTVPAGPGFISGYVVSGAGKGTSGDVPAPGMLIYLLDATTHQPLTYTYTNLSGGYSFTGLAYGTYIIHPEEYDYTTIPSSVITLSTTTGSATAVDFRQFTTSRIIKPFTIITTTVSGIEQPSFSMAPNPTNGQLSVRWNNMVSDKAIITVMDMTGRSMMTSEIEISAATGAKTLDCSMLNNGLYVISIKADKITVIGRLEIAR